MLPTMAPTNRTLQRWHLGCKGRGSHARSKACSPKHFSTLQRLSKTHAHARTHIRMRTTHTLTCSLAFWWYIPIQPLCCFSAKQHRPFWTNPRHMRRPVRLVHARARPPRPQAGRGACTVQAAGRRWLAAAAAAGPPRAHAHTCARMRTRAQLAQGRMDDGGVGPRAHGRCPARPANCSTYLLYRLDGGGGGGSIVGVRDLQGVVRPQKGRSGKGRGQPRAHSAAVQAPAVAMPAVAVRGRALGRLAHCFMRCKWRPGSTPAPRTPMSW